MDLNCAIGVDLGGQSVKLAVVDARGTIHLQRQIAIDARRDAASLTGQMIEETHRILTDARADGWCPQAIGMVMPGYMDRKRTQLTFAANLPTLGGTTFLADLRSRLELPVEFDADSNAAALAEYRFGAGQGVDRLLVTVIGTGIGGAVVVDGEILRVREHTAGSLGHVIVDARGPACKCGARGCVEARAAGPALEQLADRLATAQPASRLAALKAERGRITGVEIGIALEQNDPPAVKAVAECGWWLGAAVASWGVIYLPGRVLIGGGVASLGEPLLAAVRQGLNEVGQPHVVRGIEVRLAALGADAGVIGAAALVLPP